MKTDIVQKIIDFVITAVEVVGSIILFMVVAGVLLLMFVVAREVAWIVRNESQKRLKDKEKQEEDEE